jgi:site-specific recombinase XerD
MAGVIDTTLFSLVRDFFKVYLPDMRHSSPHTIRAYQTSLEMLFDFVKDRRKISLSEITFDMIDHNTLSAFLDWLENGRGCGIATRNHRLMCIGAFYAYAAKMEPTAVIYQAELAKVPRKKPDKPELIDYMSETAVKAILAQPDTSTPKGLRDRFLLMMFYDTAARIQEVLDIRLSDIRLGATPTVLLHGKGSKTRAVPLMEKTVGHFQNYIKVFHPGESAYSEQYLFYVARNGLKNRMCDDNARRLMFAYGEAAKKVCPDVPGNIHPHLWRHSRAMHLYQHGMDLTLISQWLGHARLDTTFIYAHADTEQKRRAIAEATPPDSPLKEKLNAARFTVDDDAVLKRLYGLR